MDDKLEQTRALAHVRDTDNACARAQKLPRPGVKRGSHNCVAEARTMQRYNTFFAKYNRRYKKYTDSSHYFAHNLCDFAKIIILTARTNHDTPQNTPRINYDIVVLPNPDGKTGKSPRTNHDTLAPRGFLHYIYIPPFERSRPACPSSTHGTAELRQRSDAIAKAPPCYGQTAQSQRGNFGQNRKS